MRLKFLSLFCLSCLLLAQKGAKEPVHAPLALPSPVQDKNFYLLSMIERNAEARDAVLRDPSLAQLAAARIAALDNAVRSCANDAACYATALRFSDTDRDAAGHALAALYRSSPTMRGFVDGPLRSSGMYIRYGAGSGDEMLERAWSDCANGINRMIGVYGLGERARYPAIDSMTYDPTSANWKLVVRGVALVLEDDREHLGLFFSSSMRFALELIFMNHSDEAGREEPLDLKANAAAFHRAQAIEWSRYPYSVIVVPGAGGDRPGVRLSPGGKLRDEIAVKRFRERRAPFLLVSGGYVHPERTDFSEAIEMKRDLMTRFGVAEDAIIIDPHARHTTTNMRNAARLMYRYGIPFDKKALATSDPQQSTYIEGSVFEKRCLDELGYKPYRLLGRVSIFDLEFVPTLDSLEADPADPLDP
jgi:hypothetical protein